MNDLFSDYAKDKERDFLREADRIKWLEDARRKGYKVDGLVARAAKAVLTRLITIGI